MIIWSQDAGCTLDELEKKKRQKDDFSLHVCHLGDYMFSSPLALVLITSSKILELSTQLFVIRRTVYSVPGSSPSMMWKVLEEFSMSDIFQLPSPTQDVHSGWSGVSRLQNLYDKYGSKTFWCRLVYKKDFTHCTCNSYTLHVSNVKKWIK